MKIALKYGLLVTLGVIAWVVVAHLLVPDPTSKVHSVGAGIFFNLLEIAGIYLGISAKGRERGGKATFKECVKTGVAIAFVYALSASLFFLIQLLFLGPQVLAGEPGAQRQPLWQVAAAAFTGLFVGSLLFGLVYATVISFFLANRQPHSS
jgi:FtsH-binding integral membrane protein